MKGLSCFTIMQVLQCTLTEASGIFLCCVSMLSPWLLDAHMDYHIREIKDRVGDLMARLKVNGTEQSLLIGLLTDNFVGRK